MPPLAIHENFAKTLSNQSSFEEPKVVLGQKHLDKVRAAVAYCPTSALTQFKGIFSQSETEEVLLAGQAVGTLGYIRKNTDTEVRGGLWMVRGTPKLRTAEGRRNVEKRSCRGRIHAALDFPSGRMDKTAILAGGEQPGLSQRAIISI